MAYKRGIFANRINSQVTMSNFPCTEEGMSEENSPRGSQINEIELVMEDGFNAKSVLTQNHLAAQSLLRPHAHRTPDVSPTAKPGNDMAQPALPVGNLLECPKNRHTRRRSKTSKFYENKRPTGVIEIRSDQVQHTAIIKA